ncbi:MAG: hypothetical protein ACPH5V_11075, partial [Alcanivorax sp.]
PQQEVSAGREYIAATYAKQTLQVTIILHLPANALIYNDAPDVNAVNLCCTMLRQNDHSGVTSCLPYKSLTRRFSPAR